MALTASAYVESCGSQRIFQLDTCALRLSILTKETRSYDDDASCCCIYREASLEHSHSTYMQANICKPSDLWRVANHSPTRCQWGPHSEAVAVKLSSHWSLRKSGSCLKVLVFCLASMRCKRERSVRVRNKQNFININMPGFVWFLLIDWWNNAKHMQYTTLCQKYAEEHQNQKTQQNKNTTQSNKTQPSSMFFYQVASQKGGQSFFHLCFFVTPGLPQTHPTPGFDSSHPFVANPQAVATYISEWRDAKVVEKPSKKGQKWWVPPWKNRHISPKSGNSEDKVLFYMSHCLPEKMSPYRLASSCFIFSGRLLCSARIVSSISSLGPVAGTSHIETSSSQNTANASAGKFQYFHIYPNLKSPGNWWIWFLFFLWAVNLHHLGFQPKVGKV